MESEVYKKQATSPNGMGLSALSEAVFIAETPWLKAQSEQATERSQFWAFCSVAAFCAKTGSRKKAKLPIGRKTVPQNQRFPLNRALSLWTHGSLSPVWFKTFVTEYEAVIPNAVISATGQCHYFCKGGDWV
jgi:hypothetical protein